jgi:putative glutamine amidotransferase
MTQPPLILVSPCTQPAGFEMNDPSISLSSAYPRALMDAGGLPLILPSTICPELLAECVRRCDGVLLTGGDDICPDLYAPDLSAALRAKVTIEDPERDLRELLLIEELFRQGKPLLAICRGHQMLNVAFGGTLIADIPSQQPSDINHRSMDAKRDLVHEITLVPDSLLAQLTGRVQLGVNSTHHQAVDRVAGPLRVTGRASDGIAEVIELKPDDRAALPFLLSVQFHPERLVDRYPEHGTIFQAFVAACQATARRRKPASRRASA